MARLLQRVDVLAAVFGASMLSIWAFPLAAVAAAEETPPAPKIAAAQTSVRMDVNKPGLTDTSETHGTAKGHLLLTNQGTAAVTALTITAVYSDGTEVEVTVTTDDDATGIETNAFRTVDVSFGWAHNRPDTGWFIVQDSSGAVAPITVPFQIRELVPGSIFLRAAIYSAIAALVVCLYVHLSLTWHPPAQPPGPPGWVTPTHPSASWSFKESWASNLTTTGAILGTVLAASGFLTDVLPGLSTGLFLGVSLGYGFLALFGPIVYIALQAQGAPIYGAVLVAGTVTVWAALGGIATVALLIGRGGVPVEWGIAVGLVMLMVVARYARSTIAQLLTPPPAPAPGAPAAVGATAAVL
jgi:hypothetical protein